VPVDATPAPRYVLRPLWNTLACTDALTAVFDWTAADGP